MDGQTVMEVSREAIWVFLKISTPLMLVALGVGLIVSLVQALTQIQENTLSFVPKVVVLFLFLMLYMPYIGSSLETFHMHLMERVVGAE